MAIQGNDLESGSLSGVTPCAFEAAYAESLTGYIQRVTARYVLSSALVLRVVVLEAPHGVRSWLLTRSCVFGLFAVGGAVPAAVAFPVASCSIAQSCSTPNLRR